MEVIFECSTCRETFGSAQEAVNCHNIDFEAISQCCRGMVSSYEDYPEEQHCYSCGQELQTEEQTVLLKGNWHMLKRDGSFPQITERVRKYA